MRALTLAALLSVALMPVDARAQEPVYEAGKDVSKPRVVKEVRPRYPAEAKNRKVQGGVELQCVVRSDGAVTDIRVTRPLDSALDVAAIDALKQWVFEPGLKDGRPVNVRVTVEFTFTLRDRTAQG